MGKIKRLLLIIVLMAMPGVCFSAADPETSLKSTRVVNALRKSLNSAGQWTKITFKDQTYTFGTPIVGTANVYTDGKDIFFIDSDGTASSMIAGAAGGDSVSIDGVAVVDPDFVSTGDIDFVDTANTVTANINAGTVDSDELASTAVTPGSYTSSDITVDADGRVTAASSGAGGGDVTAGSNLGDNLLIRGDGAVKGIQNSGITVDDSDNITGVETLTVGDGAGTLTGKVEIGGEADQNQLVVEGFSTQTKNIVTVQNDADTPLFTVDNTGIVGAAGVFATAVGLDGVGAVDLDYGSADVTDHTFITANAGDGSDVELPAGSIESDEILDGTILVGDMAVNSIDSDQYVDGSIDTAHYASGSVDATAMGADSVGESELIEAMNFSPTGTWNFGGATQFEIINSATYSPGVVAGQIGLDVTITSHNGMLRYYDGVTEMIIPAIPTADLTTTDGHVIDYNAAGTKFTMAAPASGGETNSLEVVTTGIATTEIPIGTGVDTVAYAALSGDATMDNAGAVTVAGTHSGSAHHAESHTVASHSDTTATGAETETLTDGSNADSLHVHASAGLSGIVNADLSGTAGITNANLALTAGRSLTESTNDISADPETYIYKAKIAFEDPTNADNFFFDELQEAVTFTSIYAKTLVGTAEIDIQIAGVDINGTDISVTTSGILDSSLGGDTSGAVGEEVKLAITSVASAPTFIMVILTGTYDD